MVQINFGLKEISCKIVYYGPGMSGKTTNLEMVHKKAPENMRGNMTSISTEGERTLFFDFMPLDLGTVAGMKTKFLLYTVPGQSYYNATRKLVLQGADGLIFVADSNVEKRNENIESIQNLEENLREHGFDLKTIPCILQYNKRDLPKVMTLEEMNADLNKFGMPVFEAVAYKGDGVMPTLKALAKVVLDKLNDQYGGKGAAHHTPAAAPVPAHVEAPKAPTAIPMPPKPIAPPPPPPRPVMPAPVASTPPAPKPSQIPEPVRAAVPAPKPEEKSGGGFFGRVFGMFRKK